MTQNERYNKIYNEVKQLQKTANQRLYRLEKSFDFDTYSVKKITKRLSTEKLSAFSNNNRILVNKKMTLEQLQAVKKATSQFLASESSTVSGVKNIKRKAIKGLQKNLDTSGVSPDLSYQQAENFYRAMGDDIVKQNIFDFMTPSEFWAHVNECKEENSSYEDFVEKVKKHIEIENDTDLLETLKYVYDTYII